MKRRVFNILLVVFILIFLVSGCFLLDYFLQSRKQQDSFRELSAIMEQAAVPRDETIPDSPELPLPEGEEAEPILPEFAELYAMNPHLVGWLTIDGTAIHYPVMQTPESPDYYLHRDFYGQDSSHGCIYVREQCDVFAPSDNLTIYGHRMKDGSMFYDLTKYLKQDFYQEHPYISFNTLTQYHTYQVFAVFTIAFSDDSPFPYHLFVDAADAAEFDAFVDSCLAYSVYDTGIVPAYGDKLITLSTCEYTHENGRLVVVAKRID